MGRGEPGAGSILLRRVLCHAVWETRILMESGTAANPPTDHGDLRMQIFPVFCTLLAGRRKAQFITQRLQPPERLFSAQLLSRHCFQSQHTHEFSPAGFRGQGYGCELAEEDVKSVQVSRLLPLPKALGARLSNDLDFHGSITEGVPSVNWL